MHRSSKSSIYHTNGYLVFDKMLDRKKGHVKREGNLSRVFYMHVPRCNVMMGNNELGRIHVANWIIHCLMCLCMVCLKILKMIQMRKMGQ